MEDDIEENTRKRKADVLDEEVENHGESFEEQKEEVEEEQKEEVEEEQNEEVAEEQNEEVVQEQKEASLHDRLRYLQNEITINNENLVRELRVQDEKIDDLMKQLKSNRDIKDMLKKASHDRNTELTEQISEIVEKIKEQSSNFNNSIDEERKSQYRVNRKNLEKFEEGKHSSASPNGKSEPGGETDPTMRVIPRSNCNFSKDGTNTFTLIEKETEGEFCVVKGTIGVKEFKVLMVDVEHPNDAWIGLQNGKDVYSISSFYGERFGPKKSKLTAGWKDEDAKFKTGDEMAVFYEGTKIRFEKNGVDLGVGFEKVNGKGSFFPYLSNGYGAPSFRFVSFES